MKESFETNLASQTTEETSAKETFASMKASKTEEITSATELIDSKTAELADTDAKNAQSKEDLEDTNSLIAADTNSLTQRPLSLPIQMQRTPNPRKILRTPTPSSLLTPNFWQNSRTNATVQQQTIWR